MFMSNLKAKEYENFENIKIIREDGTEYWSARELSKIFFDKIPVKKISPEQNECFRTAVTSIQLDYTKEAAASIDTMLFDLYNLTNEERKVIEYIEIK